MPPIHRRPSDGRATSPLETGAVLPEGLASPVRNGPTERSR